jgi:tetratricopeptide (TPR) repeat protein
MTSLNFLGKGLLREVAEEFPDVMYDGGRVSIGELEAGVRLEPGVAARHRDMGCRLLQDAKPTSARQAFARALKLDPDDPLSRLGLACALDAVGSIPAAIEELQFCLNARPEYCPAIVSLGYCFQKSGKPREAIRMYEQALRMNPKLERTRARLASIIHRPSNEFPELKSQRMHLHRVIRVRGSRQRLLREFEAHA